MHELNGLPHLGACLIQATHDAIEEFMSAIELEIQQRYQVLEKYSVSNIYQYLKLQKTSETSMEDMPHMVIVFDEIAELKLNYPDVFSRLKTMGSRMNSALLGIHLIFSA